MNTTPDRRAVCANCGDDKTVSVSVPCPCCIGDGMDEVTALRNLHQHVLRKFPEGSRTKRMTDLLADIATSKGRGKA